jgi:hypothetical protein
MDNGRKAVACIGRRDLTLAQRTYLESVGMHYAEQGYIITSGNAPGADQAFALGASTVNPDLVELYLPWRNFNAKDAIPGQKFWTADQALPEHIEVAKGAHSRWEYLKDSVRKLMIRNAMIVMRFGCPVQQVVAFPNNQKLGWGGTGHGVRCAGMVDVPVFLLNEQRYWSVTEGMEWRIEEKDA